VSSIPEANTASRDVLKPTHSDRRIVSLTFRIVGDTHVTNYRLVILPIHSRLARRRSVGRMNKTSYPELCRSTHGLTSKLRCNLLKAERDQFVNSPQPVGRQELSWDTPRRNQVKYVGCNIYGTFAQVKAQLNYSSAPLNRFSSSGPLQPSI